MTDLKQLRKEYNNLVTRLKISRNPTVITALKARIESKAKIIHHIINKQS